MEGEKNTEQITTHLAGTTGNEKGTRKDSRRTQGGRRWTNLRNEEGLGKKARRLQPVRMLTSLLAGRSPNSSFLNTNIT